MSSSEQQSTTNRSNEGETMYDRVRKLPEYEAWVESGGLDEFAKAHNVQPDFVDELFDAEPKVQIAYDAQLRTMPSLRAEMRRDTSPDQPFLSNAVAQKWILDYELGEYWEEDESDDDDKEEKDKKGKEEEADVLSKIADSENWLWSSFAAEDRVCNSSPFRPRSLWPDNSGTPMKRSIASAQSSPAKRQKTTLQERELYNSPLLE